MMLADDELRERFRDLRHVDDARTPEFPVVDRARARRATAPLHRSPVVWLAAAAAVVVGLIATQRLRATNEAAAQSITTWQSPTSSLVPASGRAVFSPSPLLSSVLDGATSSALWRKGD
jgi:hypothetical protein